MQLHYRLCDIMMTWSQLSAYWYVTYWFRHIWHSQYIVVPRTITTSCYLSWGLAESVVCLTNIGEIYTFIMVLADVPKAHMNIHRYLKWRQANMRWNTYTDTTYNSHRLRLCFNSWAVGRYSRAIWNSQRKKKQQPIPLYDCIRIPL